MRKMNCTLEYVNGHIEVYDGTGAFLFSADTKQEALDVPVVGLSALMTTTVVSMEETIKQLREKKPGTKVVVGGAVLTQEYADSIGADCYAKDAMATVHYADSVFGV